MDTRLTTGRRRVAALVTATLAVVLAAGAMLAPAEAQLDPTAGVGDALDDTIDSGQAIVDDAVGGVDGPVGDTVDTVQGVIDDVQGTIGEVIDDPTTALPTVPTLPRLPALPGTSGPASNTGSASGGAVAGETGVMAPRASKGEADAPRRSSAARQNAPRQSGAAAGRGRSVRVLSSADIIALLEEAGAPATTVRRVLAPFPVAGTAEYADDGSGPAMVDIEVLDDRAPVVAVSAGTVMSVVQGDSGESDMVIRGDDGTAHTYRGVELTAASPRVGEAVERADVLGAVDGILGFGQGPETPTFLEDALGHARAKAGLYATAMSVARALFGGFEVDAVPAASVEPVPLPRGLVLGAAALLVAVSLGLAGVVPASAPPARFRRRRPVTAPARG